MYEIEVIKSLDGLEKMKVEWDGLFRRAKTDNIFLSYEWIRLWHKHLGHGKELFIVVARKNKIIEAIAPLMISKKGLFWGRKAEFIGYPLSDYGGFIFEKDNSDALNFLLDYIIRSNCWDVICLDEIPEDSELLKKMPGIISSITANYFTGFSNKSMGICLKSLNQLDLIKVVKKKDVVRNIKKLKRLGKLSIEEIGLDDYGQALNELFRLHTNIWENKNERSMFSHRLYRDFFAELSGSLSRKGKALILVLKLDDKILAVQLGFFLGDNYLMYCWAYDTEFAIFGPGMVFKSMIIEYFYKKGLSAVDFSRGTENYKKRFANFESSNYSVVICRDWARYRLCRALYAAKEKVIKDDKMHNWVSNIKRILSLSFFNKP